MRILKRYLLKEFATYFLIALSILTFIMLIGNLIKFAYLIINKGVNIMVVSKLFIYLIPYLFLYTVPVACLAGIILSLGRLSYDNEIIAMRTSGINLFLIILPFIIFGIVLSLGLVILNDSIVPKAHFATRKTIIDLGIKKPTAYLEAGRFIDSFDKYIIFIYKIDEDENKLYNIRIYEPQKTDQPIRTTVAKTGEFITYPDKRMVKLKLMHGTMDQPDPRNPNNLFKVNFTENFINLNLAKGRQISQKDKKPKDMSIKELKEKIDKLKSMNIDPGPLYVHIHEKFAMAFSCLAFILFGIPLATKTHRKKKSFNIGLVFLIAGIYYLSFIGTIALSKQGILPAPTIWLPNLILSLAGLILIYRLCAS